MDVHEIEFTAAGSYDNPYMEVDLWVELQGPNNVSLSVPAFWDGGSSFKARLVGTSAGHWQWSTGGSTGDSGLDNQSGSFQVTDVTEADKIANPNKRGFLQTNGRFLEYADGTPFFYTADTVWSALTNVFPWDESSSSNAPSGTDFRHYFNERKQQGFNGVNVIASFPTDSHSELSWDGQSKRIWHSSLDKRSGNNFTPFQVSYNPDTIDYTRINPAYWSSVDNKMEYWSENGIVPFFEAVRRHEWYYENSAQKNAFVNYTRYLWARYGCYNMIYSWVHMDLNGTVPASLGNGRQYDYWLPMVRQAHNYLKSKNGTGKMPYGQPRSAMAYNTSLTTWNRDVPDALDLQNISNSAAARSTQAHGMLRDIFADSVNQPALNLEPYYPGSSAGKKDHDNNSQTPTVHFQPNAVFPGFDATTAAQLQMYGSVLNGGFAGHAWGDTFYGGVASWVSSEPGAEGANNGDPQVNALALWDSQSMGHLKDFMLDTGHDYRKLTPVKLPNQSTQSEFRALAMANDKSFALGFVSFVSQPQAVENLIPDTHYTLEWWDVSEGGWSHATTLTSLSSGTVTAGDFVIPSSGKNWAFRLKAEGLNSNLATASNYSSSLNWDTDGTYTVANAHDGHSQTRAHSAAMSAGEQTWIEYTLDTPHTITNAAVQEDNAGNHEITHWHVMYFDGSWHDAFSSVESNSTALQHQDFPDITGVTKFRLVVVTPSTSDPRAEVVKFELYGYPEDDVSPPLTGELVGHWTLDETTGTVATDSSGNQLHGNLQGSSAFNAQTRNGQVGSALNFNGFSHKVELPDIDNEISNAFSLSAWIYPLDADQAYQGIFGTYSGSGFMSFIHQGKLTFALRTTAGRKLISKGQIISNAWQKAELTYDGSNMRWYINGELISEAAHSGTLNSKLSGVIGYSNYSNEYFSGSIDDVKLYNRARSTAEISSDYASEASVVNVNVNLATANNYYQTSTSNNQSDWNDPQYPLSHIHDGNDSSKAHSNIYAAGKPVWVEYRLERGYTLSKARILEDNAGNHSIDQWQIQYFDGAWNDAFALRSSTTDQWQEVDLGGVQNVSRFRLLVTTPQTGQPRAEVLDFQLWGY